MSAATDVFENGILSLFLENANYANVGDATGLRGSSTAGVLYVSLHTASPGETGTQSTSETSYGSYVRSGGSVARSTSGWTVSGGSGTNDGTITYASCSSGSATITHFGIGSDSTSTGNLFIYGTVSPNLSVSTGITPSFAPSALTISLA
jgi:hypothetical protein